MTITVNVHAEIGAKAAADQGNASILIKVATRGAKKKEFAITVEIVTGIEIEIEIETEIGTGKGAEKLFVTKNAQKVQSLLNKVRNLMRSPSKRRWPKTTEKYRAQ
jgi:hypothetical protein